MKKQPIAIFGSAFNPPHLGHEDVITQALTCFSHIILLPSYQHAFGKSMLPYDLRLAMTHAMADAINIDKTLVSVSDIEKALANKKPKNAPVFTYDVLCHFEQALKTSNLVFIVGPDNAQPEIWQKFYKADEIKQRWQVWCAQERLPIRSSAIRNNIEKNIYPNTDTCRPAITHRLKQYFSHAIKPPPI